jgi:hypothetical protein
MVSAIAVSWPRCWRLSLDRTTRPARCHKRRRRRNSETTGPTPRLRSARAALRGVLSQRAMVQQYHHHHLIRCRPRRISAARRCTQGRPATVPA